VTEKPTWEQIQRDRDERVALPLDPEEALKGLLQVDPDSPPADAPERSAEPPDDK
jgi:hypothetical protein